VESCHTHRSE